MTKRASLDEGRTVSCLTACGYRPE